MKVLFVSSDKDGEISPITKSQGNSLKEIGVEIEYFLITEKGYLGYLKTIPLLKKHLNKNNYDLIHSHYSLSAFVAALSGGKPLVASLMGSDLRQRKPYLIMIKFFQKYFWDTTIVKSNEMKELLGKNSVQIIPNGVDLELFRPKSQSHCQEALNWDKKNTHILFAADPERHEKNFDFFLKSFQVIKKKVPNIEYHLLVNISYKEVPLYLNAADVVCISSLWEGSPNVVKEAMSCNRPIVATDVGDVNWLFGETEGCYISSFSTNHYVEKLLLALKFSELHGSTNSRGRIEELSLDSVSIAEKIISIYNTVIK